MTHGPHPGRRSRAEPLANPTRTSSGGIPDEEDGSPEGCCTSDVWLILRTTVGPSGPTEGSFVKMRRSYMLLGTALILAMVLSLVAMPVVAQTESPPAGSAATVVPPTEEPLGVSYAEWGAGFWEWLINAPPIEDPEAGDCQAAQEGQVFNIPHVPPGVTATTDCAVGAEQWILASAGGTIWDNSDGSGNTPEDLLALVEADIPIFSDPAISIDGEEVADIESYWVINPGFTIEYAEDNLFGLPAGSWDAAMGGWFVMIPPLEPGPHTIVVRDYLDDPADEEGPLLAELTANVTVEPAE